MQHTMSRLVSAIIPTYNRADLLVRALDSVIAQDYRPLEVVLVDDGSTDHTPGVVEQYREKLPAAGIQFVFHRQSNGRAPLARNNGMKLASGDYYAFLDSDDLWRPEFVSTLMRLLSKYPSAGLALSGLLVIDDNDHVWAERNSGLQNGPEEGVLRTPFEMILRHMPMQTSGVMVRRSVVNDLGDFDLNLPVVEDWDLWYRVAKKYDFAYTTLGLACNRCHPDNLPKYDARALNSGILMNLKHLPDVQDPETRDMLQARIGRQLTLLQEELLRTGHQNNGYSHLLKLDIPRRGPRYELGQLMCDAPPWVGQSYGWLVRTLGDIKRGLHAASGG